MQSQSTNTARIFEPGPWQSRQATAAAIAREAAQNFARLHLRLDFADAPYWRALASARGLRLPAWYVQGTAGRLKRYAEGTGLSIAQIADSTGCNSYRSFLLMNPTWPLFAQVGILLELAHDLGTTTDSLGETHNG